MRYSGGVCHLTHVMTWPATHLQYHPAHGLARAQRNAPPHRLHASSELWNGVAGAAEHKPESQCTQPCTDKQRSQQ